MRTDVGAGTGARVGGGEGGGVRQDVEGNSSMRPSRDGSVARIFSHQLGSGGGKRGKWVRDWNVAGDMNDNILLFLN